MMKAKHFLFTFSILLSTIALKAQTTKSFTPDPQKFPKEMEIFFNESNGKEAADVLLEFTNLWKTNKFDANETEDIYRTANAMLGKRMKPFPEFKSYLSVLISFAKSKQSNASIDGWQTSIDTLLRRPNRYFNSFINTCNLLFQEHAVYSSSTTKWKVNSDAYSFAYDSLPKVVFQSIDLTCIAKGDSSTIYGTKGTYYPSKNLWLGQEGKVYWDRAGVSRDTVFASLRKYKIELEGTDYIADSVSFTHIGFFKTAQKGRYSDKLQSNNNADKTSYPRFDSYNAGMELKNIAPDVDYKGGFSMHGNKLLGSGGTKGILAVVTFYRNRKPFIIAKSRSFLIKPDRIVSQNASLKIFIGADSITHPNLEIKLLKEKHEVTINRSDLGVSKSPFYNSFHQVNMYFEQIRWLMGDTAMVFKMISGGDYSVAEFESVNYFSMGRYDKILSLSEVSPLLQVKQYSEKVASKTFNIFDFAKFIKQSETQTQQLLLSLSNQGFLEYDYVNEQVTVRDMVQFYLSAQRRKSDYDVVKFSSATGAKENASLSLKNYDLKLNGVKKVYLSDSQNVYIKPAQQLMVLKKNRDFTCDGIVYAGRFEFYGRSFAFDYANFKINLDNIDSVRFKIPGDTTLPNGMNPLVLCKSVIEKVTGDLQVDHPKNKSGVMVEAPMYPIFNSRKESYVYYDRQTVQGGVYKRDRDFKFALEPFTIDSLDNFTKEGVAFKGEFASASIFPNFKDVLKMQPDLSLGFVRETPAEGFPAYKDKGKYTATVNLSNIGLRGNGELDYLASNAKSREFMFLPDSTNAIAYAYEMRKESVGATAFPSVKANDVYIHWEPYNDVMFLKQNKDPFEMYDGKAKLTGSLAVRPVGITGNGTMDYEGSALTSNSMKLNQTGYTADTADFKMNSADFSALSFSSTNVKATVDLEKHRADFTSNNLEDYVKFPINQYIGYYDKFAWLMDTKELEFGGSDKQGRGYEFVSVHPQQDSLRFNAPAAVYSLANNIITTKKVDHIDVADAAIYPDTGRVVIEKDAVMRTLEKAKVIANRDTKYHTIFDASINIAGRKSYTGTGSYDIVNNAMKFKKTIQLEKIGVDDSIHTYAHGNISDSIDFSLSPQIAFKGAVNLKASDPLLTYNGFGKIRSKCLPEAAWFKFQGRLQSDSLMIPIEDFTDDKGRFLAAAIGFAEDSSSFNLKGMFLTEQTGSRKEEILSSKGFLTYNDKAKEFRIGSKEKIFDPEEQGGNYLVLKENKCTLYGEGDFVLSNDWGQLNMRTLGSTTFNFADGSSKVDAMLVLDFFFPDAAFKAFNDDIAALSLDPSDTADANTHRAYIALMGKEKADDYTNEIAMYGTAKSLPKELVHSMVFNNVHFKWDNFNKCFRSEGKFEVASVQKEQINKIFAGKIEVFKKLGRDVLNIYLESDEQGYYYFNYEGGVMQAISSNEAFNEAISMVKPEKATLKADKEKPEYRFVESTDKKKNEFLRKVNYRSGR